jgi:hypothetical protein
MAVLAKLLQLYHTDAEFTNLTFLVLFVGFCTTSSIQGCEKMFFFAVFKRLNPSGAKRYPLHECSQHVLE